MYPFDPSSPVSADFRDSVSARILSFLDDEKRVIDAIGAELSPVLDAARDYTAGGKRLRPAFCYWGHAAAADQPIEPTGLLQAAASLEFLHVSALVHDDLMDHSDTRRGLPSVHRRFEAAHGIAHGDGPAEQFGCDIAILLGDLLLMWSSQMFTSAPVKADRLAAATPLLDAMRTEVTCGQVLDVTSQSGMAGSDSNLLSTWLAGLWSTSAPLTRSFVHVRLVWPWLEALTVYNRRWPTSAPPSDGPSSTATIFLASSATPS